MTPLQRTSVLAALLASLLAALGCTSAQPTRAAVRIKPEDLLAGASLRANAGAPFAAPEDVLAVSPEMQTFVDTHVERNGTDTLKLRQLVAAIIDSKTFGVEYDDSTRTASGTFRARRGNCFSFAGMFVAMARNVGLKAEFQEVDVPPDWTFDRETYVLNQHVNIRVDLGVDGIRIVDFNIADFKSTYDMRSIQEGRALAHYFNNIGVERMQAGDTSAALACFRTALTQSQAQFSPAWSNLGTLYLRNGDAVRAEAAYLRALEANSADLVAMSDLARLYDLVGEHDKATAYQRTVIRHRTSNPYYRYELARRAYSGQKSDEAIDHLKFAIRKRPKEDQFYFLLGLTYLQKGDAQSASRWVARAQEVAATDALKRKYASKIDILLHRAGSEPR